MMRHSIMVRFLALMLVLPGFSACNRSSSSGYERYIPSTARAQEAMDLAMAAWKRGEAAGPLKLNSAAITVQVVDITRRLGQRLVDYELLGEISGEGPRAFVVRLKLENPSAVREVRYYLIGIDPLWVFHQQDYESLMHWDVCEPDEPENDDHQHTLAERQPALRTEGR